MADKQLRNKAVKIKGKDYVLVSDRVVHFNEAYAYPMIETSYELIGDTFIVKAVVSYLDYNEATNEWPRLSFTGHSQATIGDGMVNKTAALENAETSAVGRALAMMGIGVIESIASADEMNKAVGSNGTPSMKFATPKQVKWIEDTVAREYNLDNQESINETIKNILTVEAKHVPLAKVKSAVDRIVEQAAKDRKEMQGGDDVVITDIPDTINLDDIPY